MTPMCGQGSTGIAARFLRAAASRFAGQWGWLILALGVAGTCPAARAELQFDVFLGYDGVVREANWFPMAFEVYNDGPGFEAAIEFGAGQLAGGMSRRLAFELPTNTRKRFVIPVFSTAGRYAGWEARLLDARGKTRAERTAIRGKDLVREAALLGALPRTFGGLPVLPQGNRDRPELQPTVSRLQVDYFPDNPIALEGMTALYLSSEKALELKAGQVSALLFWVHSGGHLIVGVEQPQDVTATPWLRQLLPCELQSVETAPMNGEFLTWLRAGEGPEPGSAAAPLTPGALQPRRRAGRAVEVQASTTPGVTAEEAFDQGGLVVSTAKLLDARPVVSVGAVPAVVAAARGRGQVTVLLFSPEREPFRSWKNRPWFWARLLAIPPSWFGASDFNLYGGQSVDGYFGALLDSKQIRPLPVKWLLGLLVVYLLVIGPVDQYWLKKTGKQMYTWLTFPGYVVLFSLLIWLIGYKLRAGETEWNELSLVDILERGEKAELRGRSFVSIYSSANAEYPLASDQKHATLRGEFQGYFGGRVEGTRSALDLKGEGYAARVAVPVWMNQLFVSDWVQGAPAPLRATVTRQGEAWKAELENRLARPLTDVRLAVGGYVFEVGNLPPQRTTVLTLGAEQGKPVAAFVQEGARGMNEAAMQRQHVLGDNRSGNLPPLPLAASVVSFVSLLDGQADAAKPVRVSRERQFLCPAGVDVAELVERGDAVVLAWDAGAGLVPPLHRFNPLRIQRNALLRLAVPVQR